MTTDPNPIADRPASVPVFHPEITAALEQQTAALVRYMGPESALARGAESLNLLANAVLEGGQVDARLESIAASLGGLARLAPKIEQNTAMIAAALARSADFQGQIVAALAARNELAATDPARQTLSENAEAFGGLIDQLMGTLGMRTNPDYDAEEVDRPGPDFLRPPADRGWKIRTRIVRSDGSVIFEDSSMPMTRTAAESLLDTHAERGTALARQHGETDFSVECDLLPVGQEDVSMMDEARERARDTMRGPSGTITAKSDSEE